MRGRDSVKKALRDAYKALTGLDEDMADLCNDPMTSAYGAPVGDFYEDWSRKYRRLQVKALERLRNLRAAPNTQNLLILAITENV